MRPSISLIKFAIFTISIFHHYNSQSQTISGILGRANLIGYKSDILFQPISPIHNLYLEKMVSRRTNIGFSVSANKADFRLNSNSVYLETYKTITLRHQGKDRNVRDIDGILTQSKKGYEIYIKRFSKRNKMRNFGLFWSYKFGQIRSVNTLKTGSIVYVQDTLNTYENEKLKVTSPGRYIATNTYVGFELGRIIPFINERLLLSYSFTLNQFLDGLEYTQLNDTFSRLLEIESSNNIKATHIMTLNFGLSYAF